MITGADRRLMQLATVPKELEAAICGGDIPGVMNAKLTAAWEHYRHLQPPVTVMAGLPPKTPKTAASPPPTPQLTEHEQRINALVAARMALPPAERRALALGLTESAIQAASSLAKNFGGKPEDYYDAIQEGKGD